MPIIIAIINRKGGVGKTATTKNLAFALSKLGKKVAVADQDNSDNLTFGVDRDNLPFDYIKSDRSYAILSKFKELDYDIILLDNPPTLGQEATSSLLIADYVLIPANFTFYVEKGIIGIFESIKEIQKINPKLKLLGVLINMFDKREKDNLSKLLTLKNQLGGVLLENMIRVSSNIRTADNECLCVQEYESKKIFSLRKSTEDFDKLAKEILSKIM